MILPTPKPKAIACQVVTSTEGKMFEHYCLHKQERVIKSKKISNDQELIQSDPTSCTSNEYGLKLFLFNALQAIKP